MQRGQDAVNKIRHTTMRQPGKRVPRFRMRNAQEFPKCVEDRIHVIKSTGRATGRKKPVIRT